jgi:hypothetical protein
MNGINEAQVPSVVGEARAHSRLVAAHLKEPPKILINSMGDFRKHRIAIITVFRLFLYRIEPRGALAGGRIETFYLFGI